MREADTARLRVFLSYTSDLDESPTERSFVAAARDAVRVLGNVAIERSHPGLETADVYVALIGCRHDSPAPGRPELSYTELEHETATALGIPRLVFLVNGRPAGGPLDDRLDRFRQRLLDARLVVARVTDPDDLEARLSEALRSLTPEPRLVDALLIAAEFWPRLRQRLSTAEVQAALPELTAAIHGAVPALRLRHVLRALLAHEPSRSPARRALAGSGPRISYVPIPILAAAAQLRWTIEIDEAEGTERAPTSAQTPEDVERAAEQRIWTAPMRALGNGDSRRSGLLVLVRDGQALAPAFQFDRTGNVLGSASRINTLLQARDDPWGAASWWLSPHAALHSIPADALRTGGEERVLAAAEAMGASDGAADAERQRPEAQVWPRISAVDPFASGLLPQWPIAGSHRAYVPRDSDAALDLALRTRSFVVVVGASGAGKSRTAFEAALRLRPEPALVVPDTQETLSLLLRELGERPSVVWLDDIDRYLAHPDVELGFFHQLAQRRPKAVVLGTLTTTVLPRVTGAGRDVLELAEHVHLGATLSPTEQVWAATVYPGERLERSIPDELATLTLERLAEAIHVSYVDACLRAGEAPGSRPGLLPWNELSDEFRESSRDQARDIGDKLAAIGCVLVPGFDPAQSFSFRPEEVLLLARMEHERWLRDLVDRGYRPGPIRSAGEHPDLVDWDELSTTAQWKNLDVIYDLPRILNAVGFQIVRVTATAPVS